jgi:drug/metabolite transporter (DMT)-like permease
MRSIYYGALAAASVAIMWGFSFVAARMVLQTVTPVILATVRFAVSSLIFLPVIIVEFLRGNAPKLRNLPELGCLGFMSVSLYFVFQYIGINYAGAGISAVLVVGLVPILTGLTSGVLNRERYSGRQVFGVLLGVFGVALITLPRLILGRIDWLFYVGVICLVLDGMCWATYSTLSRKLMKETGKPLLTASYVIVLGTLFLIPMSISSDWSAVKYLRIEQWASVLFLAVGCGCVGYFLWNYSLSTMEAMKVVVWVYLEPLIAFIGEVLIFGTVPTATTILGGTGIIVGALLTTWPDDRKRNKI